MVLLPEKVLKFDTALPLHLANSFESLVLCQQQKLNRNSLDLGPELVQTTFTNAAGIAVCSQRTYLMSPPYVGIMDWRSVR